jgi:hypothetical protein
MTRKEFTELYEEMRKRVPRKPDAEKKPDGKP